LKYELDILNYWRRLTVFQIYTYRLLTEYARIIDDNQDRIGYSGDGSELDKYGSRHAISLARDDGGKSFQWGSHDL